MHRLGGQNLMAVGGLPGLGPTESICVIFSTPTSTNSWFLPPLLKNVTLEPGINDIEARQLKHKERWVCMSASSLAPRKHSLSESASEATRRDMCACACGGACGCTPPHCMFLTRY